MFFAPPGLVEGSPSPIPEILTLFTSYSPGELTTNAPFSLSNSFDEIKISLFKRGGLIPDSF